MKKRAPRPLAPRPLLEDMMARQEKLMQKHLLEVIKMADKEFT